MFVLCLTRKGRGFASYSNKWRPSTLRSLNQTWSQCLLAPGTWVKTFTLSVKFEFIPDEYKNKDITLHHLTGNASPPHNINSWFQCKGQGKTWDDTADHIPHDIYVIGTQEDPLSERELADTVKSVLRNITNISFKQVSDKVQSYWLQVQSRKCSCLLTPRWWSTLCGTFGLWFWPSRSTKIGSHTSFQTAWRQGSPTLWVDTHFYSQRS